MASSEDRCAGQPRAGGIILAAIQAVRAIARGARARHQLGQQAKANYEAFRRLGDHTLRDLGFHRSEIMPVAAEDTPKAEHARACALRDVRALAERGSA